MEAEGDEGFEDAWWDSLAIDPVVDTQLQALEASANAGATPASSIPNACPLQAELHALRAAHERQQAVIDTLTRQTQQQQGEISVVRANWNRVQEQNAALHQEQSQQETAYRARLEQIQQENRRHLEKMETAAAFRVGEATDTAY